MKLKRIFIEDFKQFAGRVQIDDLEPGLNIFTGPNEAGKTTIATAVRTVFLEKHRSATLKHLVSWHNSSGQPRIEVEFVTRNQHYLLRKSFVTKPRCEMIVDGQHRLEGDAAEEALSSLLRFSLPLRGSIAPEHGGIPGLLWVTQGQTQDVDGPVTHAATHLREALNQLSGSRLDGGEDVLIAAVKQELHRLLTEKHRKPTGDFADVEAQLQAAIEQEQQLRSQQVQFEQDVDRLVQLQAEHADAEKRKPWEALEQKALAAESKVAELRAARSALEQLETLQRAGREHIQLLRERESDAGKELKALAELEAKQAQAREQADAAAAELQGMTQTIADAASALERAQQRLALALSAEQAKDLATQAGFQKGEVERLEKNFSAAQNIAAQIKATSALVSDTEVDEQKLHTLQTLEKELSGLQAKVEAAGTRIEYRLAPGKQLNFNQTPLAGTGQIVLDGEAVLRIPDVGEIAVIPGASNIAELSAQYAAKKSEHASILRTLGVASLAEAEQRLAANQNHKKELDSLRKQLKIYAPDGIEVLATAAESAKARLQTTLARLTAMPDATDAPALQEAKDAVAEATARHNACQERYRALLENRSRLEGNAASLLDQLQKQRATVQGNDWQQRQRQHQADLVDALAKENVRAQEIEAAKARLEALHAEINEGDVERYRKSAQLQRDAHTRQKGDLIALGAKLEQLGASGLGERLADASAAVEQLTRRKEQLTLRADALAMLTDLLTEERDKTVQRLQAPLLSRVEHYCRKLFPQAEVALDAALSPSNFKRNGWSAELDQLSFGTREQLGILCRLAYADLLREAQVPTLLILDDAIVHTDSARRDRIKRALLDATERHQILVFTCHPDAWDDLGVSPRNIQSMRIAAA